MSRDLIISWYKEYYPKDVKELKKKGEYEEFFDMLFKSADETQARIIALGLYPNEAFEIAYEQYLRPPQKETSSDDDDEWP
ncbi:MAG: hypothetical protein HPY53_12110 [Brevinematales bacterium]|nr:hypothetical protein [Brevinematales bacterium]